MYESRIQQVWFADYAAAEGTLAGLREWWNRIQDTGIMCLRGARSSRGSPVSDPMALDLALAEGHVPSQ